jgi:hypothetical protein
MKRRQSVSTLYKCHSCYIVRSINPDKPIPYGWYHMILILLMIKNPIKLLLFNYNAYKSVWNLTITFIIISSHRPLSLRVAALSLGVHCRLTMYKGGRSFLGRSMHHSQGYLRKTFRLDPKHNIMSAFSAAFEAPSQLIGHLI